MAVRQLVRLNSGYWMPTVGLGTFLSDSVQEAVDVALHAGYRHLDTAVSYGNEQQVGEVVNDALKMQRVKREEIFITTKIPPMYLHPSDIAHTAEASLTRLGLSYVDMILIHSPYGKRNHGDGNLSPVDAATGKPDHMHHDLVAAWRSMEELVKQGLTKSIGVSNFSISQIDRILHTAKVPISNVQAECHVFYQQNVLRAACKSNGITFTGYSPVGAPGRPARHRHDGDQDALTNPAVMEISAKHGRTAGQILIRYLLQLGVVPLPKSVNPDRIRENIDVFNFSLDATDMACLEQLNINHKFFRFLQDMTHPEYQHTEFF